MDEKIIEKIIDDIHEAIEDIKNKINEDDLDKSLGKSSSAGIYIFRALICARFKFQQVAIIGAGMSGLSAAVQLVESGITNIIVLEADNRVGGRIHTTQFRKLITISFNL